jgi:hypothetical protein
MWNLALERRFTRKRALVIAKLGLTYPTNSEMTRLSSLARVVADRDFPAQIRSVVLDAHLLDTSLRGRSMPKVRGLLNDIAKKANQLQELMAALDVPSKGSAEAAGMLLENGLNNFDFRQELVLIPDFYVLLGALAETSKAAAAAAAGSSQRGPRGTRGSPAFELFVHALYMGARQHGGKWTNYKSTDGTWKGTLLEALVILKRYLPVGFFPRGDRGRSLDHIIERIKNRNTNKRSM